MAILVILGSVIAGTGASPAAASDNPAWLRHLNQVRAEAGLGPVTINHAWDNGERLHSCYMALNNKVGHDEDPSKPGYTEEGFYAGMSSNAASYRLGATPTEFIDRWLAAPFHALAMLSPDLTQTSFGSCDNDRLSYASLDVIRGSTLGGARPFQTATFPGPNATTNLDRFNGEYPNPQTACGLRNKPGLPAVAMFPSPIPNGASVTAEVSGPGANGKTEVIPSCVLYKNKPGLDTLYTNHLGDNEVIIMPSRILYNGRYTIRLRAGSQTANWSFNVWGTCAGKKVTIVGTPGNDTIRGTAGDDVIHAGPGNDTVNGGAGNDTICGSNGNDVIDGGGGNDTIAGGGGNDVIRGGGGYDTVYGGRGNDNINGGGARDKLYGEADDDTVVGGNGNDTVSGGDGDDKVSGGDGNDNVSGNNGDDTVNGASGDDKVYGGNGRDRLFGADGDDALGGGTRRDELYGGNGDDKLYGNDGNDLLDGGAGNDGLVGGPDDDNLLGRSGYDALDGGAGSDRANGGPNRDRCTAEVKQSCES